MFDDATLERLRRRVSILKGQFTESLAAFESASLFSGPGVYFHRRTLERLRKHESAADALRDDIYVETLYATLTAWGLHRMDPGNARLLDLGDIRRNLLQNSDLIRELEPYRIADCGPSTIEQVTSKLCTLLERLRVSKARTFLVSNTKALHHLLPSLVPPVDNEYTLRFFFHSMILDGDNDEEVFRTIFPYFHELARENADVIRGAIGRGYMNTSDTKVIDNAIVGYSLQHYV